MLRKPKALLRSSELITPYYEIDPVLIVKREDSEINRYS